MSTTIDERVVEMRFDNKHFENNVQTSLNSINKLKDSLNMTGAAKGLEEIDRSAKSVNMGALGSAVETVQAKFSALQVMAVTALANITNSAVNAGKRIVSALTIDPIKTGLQEYETQINAVQTILANTESKGTTIDDVNKALDELNTYADKTIYNFTEMTRNIGTFTAAGVDLDTSVTAIQGIANLAAVSGSTSQQASTAMYQLSQALSTGTVKLMDWNSVVNAGMGGQVFQDALKETARAHGVAIDDIIASNGSFRESLQEGWLTADILTETLSHFTMAAKEGSDEWKAYKKELMDSGYTEKQAESILKLSNTATDAATKVKTFTQLWDTLKETAQSGWTQTWEIIFGDFEEAKEFFSDLYNFLAPLIEASSKARNDLLQGWKDEGGRQHLIESLYNTFEAIKSVIVPIKEAFREIFPPMTVKQLVGFTEGLKNLTANLKLGEKASDNLKRTFKGVFAVLDIAWQLISAVVKALFPMFKGFGDLGGGILGATASLGDWLVKLSETIRKTDIFNKTFQGISKVVTIVVDALKKLAAAFKEKILSPGWEAVHAFLERMHERMSGVGEAASAMKDGVKNAFSEMGNAVGESGFVKLLKGVWNVIKTISSAIFKLLGGAASKIIDTIGNANFSGIFDFINSLSFSAIGVFAAKFVKGFGDIADSVGDFKDSALDILDSVRGCFEAYQTQLKAGTLMKIAQAIAILAAAILVISFIDSEKLAASLGAVTVLFADLMASMALFGRVSGDITGVAKSCTAMIAISAAVLILAFALRTVSKIDSDKLGTGLLGILGLTAIVVASAKILGTGGKTVIKGATQMILFAAAIKILASACADLSKLKWEQLAKGLVGVGVLMAEIAVFTRIAKFSGKTILTATGIVILASAMKILASACKDFGKMNWTSIGKSLAMIGGLLAEIAIFTNLTGNAKHVISSGIALIAIAAAMKIFASAAQDIAYLSWEELGKGLAAMAGSLILITAAVRLMPKNMVGTAIGLIGIASALLILSDVLYSMSSMTWEEIGKGLATLGGSMFIIALGLNAMKSTIAGSAAMLIAAAALAILTPVLSILGAMSWESIAKGLIVIAGAFVILGVAGYVLSGAIGPILALSAALALIGVGIVAAGIGVTLLATGISVLATALAGGATAIVAALVAIVTGVAELIPFIIVKIGEGLIALCSVITEGAPAIAEAVMSIILSLCNLLGEAVPVLSDTLLKLIVAVFESLVEYTPRIVDLLFQFLIGVLKGVAENLPDLIVAAVDVLMAFFEGVVQALGGIDTETIIQGIAGIGLISGLMLALAAAGALAPAAMAGVIAMGLVVAELAIVLAAIGALAQIPGLEWLISEGGNFLQVVGTAIGQFIGGIIGGVASGVTSQIPQIGTDLSNFMKNIQPFIEGAKAIDPSTMEGVKTLTGIILALTAANILEGLTSWLTGGSSVTKFAEELPILGQGLKGFSDAVVGISPEIVAAAANAAKTLAEMTKTIPNEGGVIGWFAGENSISKFGSELPILGAGLKGFSDAVTGIVPENITSAATAAKSLCEMCKTIPNEGGVVGWFAGENSIAKFGSELPILGAGLKGFSDSVAGIIPENVIAAANAAKALAQMADTIPNEGGVVAWFAGENSIANFAGKLSVLGLGLKNFAVATAGITPETVVAAANAGKALASMTATIPKEGGIKAWFSGEASIASFAGNLPILGAGLKSFSVAVTGIVPENIVAAANAAKALAEMANVVPKEGGIKAWFTGESSIAKFSDKLPALGKGLKGFSDSVKGISPENISAASSAGKNLAQMADTAPKDTSHLTSFGTNISTFGTKLKSYFSSVGGISEGAITAAKGAIEGIKKATELNSGTIKSAADAIDEVTKSLKGMADIPKDIGTNFKKNMNLLGEDSAEALVKAVKDCKNDMKTAGEAAMNAFVDGIETKSKSAKSASSKAAKDSATEAKDARSSFESAGKYLVQGFASGITANTYLAEAKAKAMAKAAADAAKAALAIKSPSRVFYQIGDYAGEGFVNALGDYSSVSYKAGMEMADSARKGLNSAINKVADFINSDMDTQPTIRPVLDLSSVEAGASAISGLLGGSAVGVSAHVGAINTMMSRRNQNGSNAEVVSAINGLRKDLENVNHTTNVIEGITYDDGSNVSEALKTIIQAAKMERRV